MTLFQRFSKWGWLRSAIPIFILAGLALVFFSDVLFQAKIFIHRDLSRFFYPLREFSAAQFLTGKVPLWNPYIQCGSPHLAELQTSVFYPPSIVYSLFPYPQAFNYFIIIHIFLAGLFTYILMREWGYSGYASFLSAVVFMFSGYIISVINLLASLASVVWLPLVILFYERAVKKDWVKNSIFTGIFMALMFLGGEPVILYATFFILLLFSGDVLDSAPSALRSNNILRAKSRSIVLAVLVFLGLASFQILPFLEFLKHTSRNLMDFSEASMWSMPVYALLELFFPYLSESDYIYKDYWTRQSWLVVYYMGIVTVIFALISLKFDSTKRRKAVFYILALGLVLSFGRYTPVYYFLYNFLPGFRFSRYPIKFFFMAAFSLAILAGMGMDYYKAHAKKDPDFRGFLKWVLALGLIGSFLYLAANLNFYEICGSLKKMILNINSGFASKVDKIDQIVITGLHNIRRGVGLFMLLSVVMFFGIKKRVSMNLVLVFILLIAIIDIFTANRNVYQNMGIKEFLKPGETVEFLQRDKSLFRIFNSPATLKQNMFVPEKGYFEGNQALMERVVSNRGASFGIYDAYGYGSLYNRRQEEIMNIIVMSNSPAQTNLLNLLNVKYVISPKDFNVAGYRMLKKNKKVNIYENENFLQRAFLVEKAVVIKDEKKILERMKSKDFKPSDEVILEEVLDSALRALLEQYSSSERAKQVSREESVNISKYESNYVEIKAESSAPKFLVLSDTYYPGWKVYVDGKADKIYRADYILRAVYLKPGKHIVKFTYDPFSFKIGAIITLATIGILLGLWIKRLS
ncbi:MAG: YfhO family protein [Candidatus Omnitrophota bacterium]|nr:YfhO family protein [Candidatus Omnitrophota bacterium]